MAQITNKSNNLTTVLIKNHNVLMMTVSSSENSSTAVQDFVNRSETFMQLFMFMVDYWPETSSRGGEDKHVKGKRDRIGFRLHTKLSGQQALQLACP